MQPAEIVTFELRRLGELSVGNAALLNDMEYQLKLTRCINGLDSGGAILSNNHGFLSDLLLVLIRGIRAFADEYSLYLAGVPPESGILAGVPVPELFDKNVIGAADPHGADRSFSQSSSRVDRIVLLPFLCLFNLLAVVFEKYVGPTFSSRATIHGLVSEEGQTLNGEVVDVTAFDPTSGRFCVKFRTDSKEGGQHGGKGKRIKPENLEMLRSSPHSSKDSTAAPSADEEVEVKNMMAVNCLESLSAAFDFLVSTLCLHVSEEALPVGRQVCRAMWRSLVACLGRTLSAAELFELTGCDVFNCCLFSKLVLEAGDVEIAGVLATLSSDTQAEAMFTLSRAGVAKTEFAPGASTSGDAASAVDAATMNVWEGSVSEGEAFRRKVAIAFVSIDLLPVVTMVFHSAYERDLQQVPSMSFSAALENVLPNSEALLSLSGKRPRSSYVRLMAAGCSIIGFLSRRASEGETKVKRHLQLHARGFVRQLLERLLGPHFDCWTGEETEWIHWDELNVILEGLCRLKVLLPHLIDDYGVPDWAPYRVDHLPARSLFLVMRPLDYERTGSDPSEMNTSAEEIAGAREELMQRFFDVENQALSFAGHEDANFDVGREQVRFWSTLRGLMHAAVDKKRMRQEALSGGALQNPEPYWWPVLTEILRERQATMGEPFGAADFGRQDYTTAEGGSSAESYYEGEEEALKLSRGLFSVERDGAAEEEDEDLFDSLGTYYEEQQAIMMSIIMSQQNSPVESPQEDDLAGDLPPVDDSAAGFAMSGIIGGDHQQEVKNDLLDAYAFPEQASDSRVPQLSDPACLDLAQFPSEDASMFPHEIGIDENGTSRRGGKQSPGTEHRLLGELPSLEGPRKKHATIDPLAEGYEGKERSKKSLSRERLRQIGIPLDASNAPAHLLCEIDGKILGQPVRSLAGHVFEKGTLAQWIEQMGRVCPISGTPLSLEDCSRDKKLEIEIKDWANAIRKQQKNAMKKANAASNADQMLSPDLS
ncbi:unnamed protein product [Amoebophrya sp. A25]|nr:unnamed protein product [Amoebophrya sp. A25]|eukprot:GSA25T00011960001.1